jgi:tight adherence protein B
VIRAVAAGSLAASSVLVLGALLSSLERERLLTHAGWSPAARPRPATPYVPLRHLGLVAAGPGWLLGSALGGVTLGVAAAGAAVAVPAWLARRREARRRAALAEGLADGVGVIAAGLRAGRSLPGAIELAANEVPAPLGPSFRRVADRIALGEPLEDALAAWASEVGGPDARVAAGVLGLHRRTGGALAAALDGLAATLRARRTAARELRSLTAQARLSAAILGLLPIGFFLFLSVVARSDVEAAFGTTIGAGAVALGLALQGAAYVWIARLLRVEP